MKSHSGISFCLFDTDRVRRLVNRVSLCAFIESEPVHRLGHVGVTPPNPPHATASRALLHSYGATLGGGASDVSGLGGVGKHPGKVNKTHRDPPGVSRPSSRRTMVGPASSSSAPAARPTRVGWTTVAGEVGWPETQTDSFHNSVLFCYYSSCANVYALGLYVSSLRPPC